MIDDEKLQELLAKASSLYNSGEYQGAIATWQEALGVDPASQKAKEGIRMATLLLGTWEPAAAPPEEPPPPADGAGAGAPLPAEEVEARLDVGVAGIKQLLAERRYQEAVEGARALLPLQPDSEEIRRLLEEAEHAFESSPFIDEHLTLAKELLAQERFAEAEAECRKVFVLDRQHPAGQALLKEIRGRIQESLKRAASQMGGMTVKLELGKIVPAAPPPPTAAAAPEPAAPGEDAGPGELARTQEDVTARNLLDEAFQAAGVEDEPPPAPPAAESAPPDPAAAPGAEESPFVTAADPAPETPIVEARTVTPPAVRAVPSKPSQPAAPAPPRPAATPAAPAAPEDPTAWETELTQLNLKEGERGMLRGTGAKAGSVPVDQSAEVDLMSLLDNDFSGSAEPASPAPPATAPGAGAAPKVAAPVAVKPAAPAARKKERAPQIAAHEEESPAAAAPKRERPRPAVPVARRRGSSWLRWMLLLALLGGGGAGGWWYFFQPRSAGGAGLPGQVSPPPAPPAEAAAPDGPIPTPIGGSRQQAQEPRPEAAIAAVPADLAPAPAADPAVARPLAAEPIKPPTTPQLSPEEKRRKVAAYTADGRRLMAAAKWREARAKFNAVLALDPVNFEVKELADQAQAKVDEEQRLQDDLDSARRLVAEKDYENALRKLYRLPRDRGLGDIDLYIRNAWFNWAVVLMKAGNATDALQKLSEVLTLDPDDAEALKLQEVAERYVAKAKDRVYYAFVDTLKLRPYDRR